MASKNQARFLEVTECDCANCNHKPGSWIVHEVCEFVVIELHPATEVRFSMKQIDCMHSKGGLLLILYQLFQVN